MDTFLSISRRSIFRYRTGFGVLYTGTRAAKTRKETIHSRGLRRTVEKLTLYFICILLSEGFRLVFMPAVPVTYMAALAIAITELKSNIENVETVTQVKIWKHLTERFKVFKDR